MEQQGKKGDLPSAQLITILLVVIGFGMLLFLFSRIGFEQFSDEEICHLSVVQRVTVPQVAQHFVPLQCSTRKICLTSGEGKCDDAFAGESIERIVLPADEEEAARKIEEVSAQAMYRCWSMMGEGKLDVFGSYLKSRGLTLLDKSTGGLSKSVAKPTCVICSRVAVDPNVRIAITNQVNIQKYLQEHEVPGKGVTYLQAMTDPGVKAYPVVDTSFAQRLAKEQDQEIQQISIPRRELAFVFMQIKAKGVKETVVKVLGDELFFVGGVFVTPAVGVQRVLAFRYIGGALKVVTLGAALGLPAHAAINAYSGQLLAQGYCGPIASQAKDDAYGGAEGCSLVQAMPYDHNIINQLCLDLRENGN